MAAATQQYEYVTVPHDPEKPWEDWIRDYNHPKMSAQAVTRLKHVMEEVNKLFFQSDKAAGFQLQVPVLPAFARKHETATAQKKQKKQTKKTYPKKTDVKKEDVSRKITPPITKTLETKAADVPKEDPLALPLNTKLKSLGGPLKRVNDFKWVGQPFKSFPYTFINTAATIEGIIRSYNHQQLEKPLLKRLVAQFNYMNPHALPPTLGQTVMVPVLLAYCYKHEFKAKML